MVKSKRPQHPKTKRNEAKFTPAIWVHLRGRALILAFIDWYQKRTDMLPITPAGANGGDFWMKAYSPEHGAEIQAWCEKWLTENSPDKLAHDEDGLEYDDEDEG